MTLEFTLSGLKYKINSRVDTIASDKTLVLPLEFYSNSTITVDSSGTMTSNINPQVNKISILNGTASLTLQASTSQATNSTLTWPSSFNTNSGFLECSSAGVLSNPCFKDYSATRTFTGTQTLTTGISAEITLNTSSFGPASMLTVANRIKIIQAGMYNIIGKITFAASTAGSRSLKLRKTITGPTTSTIAERTYEPVLTAGIDTYFNITWTQRFVANDEVFIEGMQGSGGDLNATYGSLSVIYLYN